MNGTATTLDARVESPLERLAGLDAELSGLVDEMLADGGLSSADDADVLRVLAVAGRVQRRAEALQAAAAAVADERSNPARPREERMTTRHGARTVGELVQRVTLCSRVSANDVVAAGRAAFGGRDPYGEQLPARFPAVAAVFRAGLVGIDGLLAVSKVLGGAAGRVDPDARNAADVELAAAAIGCGADGAPASDADMLRQMAHVWLAWLDPDGVEPKADRAERRRSFLLGRERDGLVHVWGDLLPETAAQLQLVFDSILNPAAQPAGRMFRAEGDGQPADATADRRTRGQKQHDALATLLTRGAASGWVPSLGGAAPTLVVWAREGDLTDAGGSGVAHLPGQDAPVPAGVARHAGCDGAILRVTADQGGRVVSLVTKDRVFNHQQRKVIAARDGTCVIPGCRVPASWCEIHHVVEHSRGGPTSTDNGVALCWFHHHTIDTGVWQVRTRDGVPEIRGPSWWDPHRAWRPTTTSPLRLRERIAR
ncbi:DUF222 domain-containing protein [Microbacterium sp.]|uniref:HNH endonuclease signature motif containing protein n=1 Tax=Microbacterium sp. TaxID=51671 RepID=UPI003C787AC5